MARINQILPSKKEKCPNFKYYKDRVVFQITLNNYTEIDKEFEKLLRTLYKLPSEDYETIRKKYNYDYLIYRHNAKAMTSLLKESKDKVNDLGILLEIIMIKEDVIRKIVANSYPVTLTDEETSLVTDSLLHKGKGIELFNKHFKERTLKYQSNPLFSKYINSYTEDVIIRDLTKESENKLRKQLTAVNKDREYGYYLFSNNTKPKEIKKDTTRG